MFHFRSEVGIKGKNAVLFGLLDVGFLILADSLFKEISLSLQRDHIHPLERIFDVVELRDTHGEQESVSHEFDVLAHQH